MKKEILAGSLLLIILVGVFVNVFFINKLTTNMSHLINEAQDAALDGDWDTAKDIAEKAVKIWEKNGTYTHVVLRDSEIYEATEAFYSFLESIYSQETGAIKGNAMLLISRLSDILELETISIGSVF
jgi:hypothetical protein